MLRFSLLLIVVLVQSVYCAFFDLTDVDDPLSLLWHTKESTFVPNCNAVLENGQLRGGVCKPRSQCLITGGRLYSAKECGIFKSCCVTTRKCSKTTREKVSYFRKSFDLDAETDECTFTVQTFSTNVCQMRVDFEKFQFSSSEDVLLGLDLLVRKQDCKRDYMSITPQNYNLPRKFCGNNDGQHVYIHLHSSKEAQFHINLASRDGTSSLKDVDWQLKITQLECPGSLDFFSKYKNIDVASDFKMLAPEGAIQYFQSPSGRFRSFGLDGTSISADTYLSDLNYAIAFRKSSLDNCVQFTPKYAKFNEKCIDYLFVPKLNSSSSESEEIIQSSKFCPDAASKAFNFFASEVPGFLTIYFVSSRVHTGTGKTAGTVPPSKEPLAFDILYQITAEC